MNDFNKKEPFKIPIPADTPPVRRNNEVYIKKPTAINEELLLSKINRSAEKAKESLNSQFHYHSINNREIEYQEENHISSLNVNRLEKEPEILPQIKERHPSKILAYILLLLPFFGLSASLISLRYFEKGSITAILVMLSIVFVSVEASLFNAIGLLMFIYLIVESIIHIFKIPERSESIALKQR